MVETDKTRREMLSGLRTKISLKVQPLNCPL